MKNHNKEKKRLLAYRNKKLRYKILEAAKNIRIASNQVHELRKELAEIKRQEFIKQTGIQNPDPKIIYL